MKIWTFFAVAIGIFIASVLVASLWNTKENRPISEPSSQASVESTQNAVGDPKTSFLKIVSLHEYDDSLSALYPEMRAWAEFDIREAWDYLESDKLPPDIKGKMLILVMTVAWETDPEIAIEMMRKYSSSSGYGGGRGWFTNNPEAGFTMLLETPDAVQGDAMLRAVVKAWVKEDQAAVLERLLSEDIPANKRGEIEKALVEGPC